MGRRPDRPMVTRSPDHRDELSNDWMRELDADAMKFQAVISRIDFLAGAACENLRNGDLRVAMIRLAEIREGLRLVCELAGVKIGA